MLSLREARGGDVLAQERLLALYRPFLRFVAGKSMPRLLAKREDPSDVVQQTLIDAIRGLPDFRGESEPELTAWLMRLLERNILQGLRRHISNKRDVRLEVDLTTNSGSAELVWHGVAGIDSSPARRVVRGETALHLACAIGGLPEDQRTAVELRYLEELPLQAIAERMERTLGSVAGLIRRGVEALHARLGCELDLT